MGFLIMNSIDTRKRELLVWLLDTSKKEPALVPAIFEEYVDLMESNNKLNELEDFLVNNFSP